MPVSLQQREVHVRPPQHLFQGDGRAAHALPGHLHRLLD